MDRIAGGVIIQVREILSTNEATFLTIGLARKGITCVWIFSGGFAISPASSATFNNTESEIVNF
jgi:hypothetical protein